MSHYDTLGVTPDASDGDIKRAYRKKACDAHPDRGDDNTAMVDVKPSVALAPFHKGMRVDYQGLLRQSRDGLEGDDPALAEMLRQLTDHLTELAQRYYAGDVAVVDEFLQLYCVGREHREAAVKAQVSASALQAQPSALADMEARKDAAYMERNQVVAALARCFPSGVARTAIEGWAEDWHGCVYIDLPTGQASWHFHDSQAYLFKGLPPYTKPWDGHDTPEKYHRLAALQAQPAVPAGWISVGDRLPEPDSGEVLVWLDGGRCAFDEWHMYREDPTGMSTIHTLEMGLMWRDYEFDEITHWMPLPAAPGAATPTAPAASPEADDCHGNCGEPVGCAKYGCAAKEWAASSPAPAPAASDAPDTDAQLTGERAKKAWALIRFLDGRAPLDGLWFGEKSGPAPYWWRRYLPSLTSAALHYPEATPAPVLPARDEVIAALRRALATAAKTTAGVPPVYRAAVIGYFCDEWRALSRLADTTPPAGDVVANLERIKHLAADAIGSVTYAGRTDAFERILINADRSLATLKAGQADTSAALARRPNPADGAPIPPGHRPVA